MKRLDGTLKTELGKITGQIAAGDLWDGLNKRSKYPLADFLEQCAGVKPMTAGAKRLNVYMVLVASPQCLRPGSRYRAEWVDKLGLTEHQADNREAVTQRCLELAAAAHFNAKELSLLKKELASAWKGLDRMPDWPKRPEPRQSSEPVPGLPPRATPPPEPDPPPVTPAHLDPHYVVMGDLFFHPHAGL